MEVKKMPETVNDNYILEALKQKYEKLQNLNSHNWTERTTEPLSSEILQLKEEMRQLVKAGYLKVESAFKPLFLHNAIVEPKKTRGKIELNVTTYDAEHSRCMRFYIRDLQSFVDYLQNLLKYAEFLQFNFNLDYQKASGDVDDYFVP
jgi:hypothetical protein